ncbi:serine hydrolase domain-containing protein [Filimonas effusa]|uniref:Beta-lactamase-related domain-containing protein n=1 Tax=Filimonas effusa TaxID=2508721 RepID=A0A4Q1D5A8_9BACT|nr:serine hydrolase [Filimonas effusa]RXK83023.1 hypothetical protein ESB13_12930 [Filimonas effusa]
MKKQLALGICFWLGITIAAYAQQEMKLVDSIMQTAYKRGIFNGNIMVVCQNNIYLHSFGFADVSTMVPLSREFKFDIGSVSKEFNGAAIMVLCEQGKLSLEDSLSKFFPEFPSWAGQVKVAHLLNYTSGIPVLGPAADGTDSLIHSSLITLKALAAAPGTVYIYNNINVSLQRRIIEKVSGLSYQDFIQEYLFKPAGMTQSLVDYPVDAAGMARAFDNEGHNVLYREGGVKGWVRLPIGDLYRWVMALHQGKVINEASLRTLGRNFPGGESSLGTVVFEGDTVVWHQHQGSNSNYEAAFYYHVRDRTLIVMMTNNQQMKVWPLKTAILNALQHKPFTVPRRSVYLSIRDRVLANVDDGLNYYRMLKAEEQDLYDFGFEIGDLISTGKYVQRRNKLDDAIRVFETALELKGRPEDLSYCYELIGDCYKSKGRKRKALANYRKALEVYPGNKNASGMIATLTGK